MANLSRANSCSAKHSGVFFVASAEKISAKNFRRKISAEKTPKKRRKNFDGNFSRQSSTKLAVSTLFFINGGYCDEKRRKNFAFFLF